MKFHCSNQLIPYSERLWLCSPFSRAGCSSGRAGDGRLELEKVAKCPFVIWPSLLNAVSQE